MSTARREEAATAQTVPSTRTSERRIAPQRPKMARTGRWVRVEIHGHDPGQPHTQPELFGVFDEKPGGSQPPVWVSRGKHTWNGPAAHRGAPRRRRG